MKYIALFLFFMTLSACEKSQLPFYKGGEYLYFKKLSQTLSYSFVDEGTPSINHIEILIPIVLVGEADRLKAPLAYSIEYRAEDLKVIGENGNSIEEQLSLQPGQQTDTLKLNILRTELFRDTTVIVQISLHAPPPYDADILLAEELLYTRSIDVLIDDQFKEPEGWSSYEPYFGTFSSKKTRILMSLIEEDYSSGDLYTQLKYYYANQKDTFIGIAEKLFQYLVDQKEKGSPILEKSGKEMLAGPLMY